MSSPIISTGWTATFPTARRRSAGGEQARTSYRVSEAEYLRLLGQARR